MIQWFWSICCFGGMYCSTFQLIKVSGVTDTENHHYTAVHRARFEKEGKTSCEKHVCSGECHCDV